MSLVVCSSISCWYGCFCECIQFACYFLQEIWGRNTVSDIIQINSIFPTCVVCMLVINYKQARSFASSLLLGLLTFMITHTMTHKISDMNTDMDMTIMSLLWYASNATPHYIRIYYMHTHIHAPAAFVCLYQVVKFTMILFIRCIRFL